MLGGSRFQLPTRLTGEELGGVVVARRRRRRRRLLELDTWTTPVTIVTTKPVTAMRPEMSLTAVCLLSCWGYRHGEQ